MRHYDIEIEADETTPCLKKLDGTYVDTYYQIIKKISSQTAMEMIKYEKWKFDWSDADLADCTIYALYAEDSKSTQGLIACREYKNQGEVKGYIEVALVEANPKNIGKNGKYKGVGAHLFAIACEKSFELGYDGYVVFRSKSGLVSYYEQTLQAVELYDRYMQLDTSAAKRLVDIYQQKARDGHDE